MLKGVKLWRQGTGYVFSVPVAFIRHGMLSLDKCYELTLEKVEPSPEAEPEKKTEVVA